MATWRICHSVSGEVVAEQGTKKAATAQADEMTEAHRAIDARHWGEPVTFTVVKLADKPDEPVEEPAA